LRTARGNRILAQYEISGFLDLELGQSLLLESAYNGDIEVVDKLLKLGVSLDAADKVRGMTALHLAVGCDHLDLARFLVERGESFVLDKQSRMPTIIAAECRAR
jgi:ankyrin repeat protein